MASSSHIMPGEKGGISAVLDTAQKKGLLVKNINVLTNDPKKPRATLTVKTYIKEPLPQAIPAPADQH